MAVGAATHLRSMQAGFSGQGAILAAQLAKRGIVGSREIIEGRYGLFHNYVRTGKPGWDAIVGDLGQRFPMLEVHGFKVLPASGYTRATNTATLELALVRHDLSLARLAPQPYSPRRKRTARNPQRRPTMPPTRPAT